MEIELARGIWLHTICPLTGQVGDVSVHHVCAEGRHRQQHNSVRQCEIRHFAEDVFFVFH